MVVISWMGGSHPPKELPPDVQALADDCFKGHCETYQFYWGKEADDGTKETYRTWSRYDAWATLRHRHEVRGDPA